MVWYRKLSHAQGVCNVHLLAFLVDDFQLAVLQAHDYSLESL